MVQANRGDIFSWVRCCWLSWPRTHQKGLASADLEVGREGKLDPGKSRSTQPYPLPLPTLSASLQSILFALQSEGPFTGVFIRSIHLFIQHNIRGPEISHEQGSKRQLLPSWSLTPVR